MNATQFPNMLALNLTEEPGWTHVDIIEWFNDSEYTDDQTTLL